MTQRNDSALTEPCTRTRASPSHTSMNPSRCRNGSGILMAVGFAVGSAAESVGATDNSTGINAAAALTPPNSPRWNCLLQVCSWLGLMSLAIATSAVETPGSMLARTICRLNSREYRRRPGPVLGMRTSESSNLSAHLKIRGHLSWRLMSRNSRRYWSGAYIHQTVAAQICRAESRELE